MADKKVQNFNSSLKGYNTSKVIGENGSFFQGTWDFHHDNVKQYDPFINGYAFIYWTRLPEFLMYRQSLGTEAVDDYQAFKWMTMRNFKSFDGLSDIELSAEAITAGFTGNEMYAATGMTKGNTEFTLKHQELAGSPIRKLYSSWVNGIRDMDTGIAYFEDGNGNPMEYSMSNYTGELLYVVTDPSGGTMKNSIEFAAYFTNVFPTRVPMSHLNYASGEHNFTEIDIPFKGIMHVSDKINELAANNLEHLVKYRNAAKYDPMIGAYDSSTATFGKGTDDGSYTESLITGYKNTTK